MYDIVFHVYIYNGPLLFVKGCNLEEVHFPLQRKPTLSIHTTSSKLPTMRILCTEYILEYFDHFDEFDLGY